MQVWTALEAVQMKKPIQELPEGGKLSSMLAESGGNLSLGERQLLCLVQRAC